MWRSDNGDLWSHQEETLGRFFAAVLKHRVKTSIGWVFGYFLSMGLWTGITSLVGALFVVTHVIDQILSFLLFPLAGAVMGYLIATVSLVGDWMQLHRDCKMVQPGWRVIHTVVIAAAEELTVLLIVAVILVALFVL